MQVKDILQIKESVLFTVEGSDLVTEAVHMMVEHNVGSVVVLENAQVSGMLTFKEILKLISQRGHQLASVTISEIFDRTALCVDMSLELSELRRIMLQKQARYVPVLSENKVLMGVISFRDVAKAVLEEQKFENRMLKNYIKNWPEASGQYPEA